MKFIFAIALFSFAPNAFASCLNVSGTWQDQEKNEQKMKTKLLGATSAEYSFSEGQRNFVLDGKQHKTKDGAYYIGRCHKEGAEVEVFFKGGERELRYKIETDGETGYLKSEWEHVGVNGVKKKVLSQVNEKKAAPKVTPAAEEPSEEGDAR